VISSPLPEELATFKKKGHLKFFSANSPHVAKKFSVSVPFWESKHFAWQTVSPTYFCVADGQPDIEHLKAGKAKEAKRWFAGFGYASEFFSFNCLTIIYKDRW
jgi:hypothetical protein